ncbi:MAG: DUF447 domain-containing protein [Candidatus Sigynarchaeota archaeon]
MNETNTGCNATRSTVPGHGFDLRRGYLYESIVGVLDQEGVPHFAPIGVRVLELHDDGQCLLEARVFSTAATYSCLKRCGECTVHFPGLSQLDLFFLAFRDELPGVSMKIAPPAMIKRGSSVHSPVHLGIANYIEAGVAFVEDKAVSDVISTYGSESSRLGIFHLSSRVVVINDPASKPINRQDGLILEFLVKASRFRQFPSGSDEQHASLSQLVEIIEKMEKVAPGDDKNALAREIIRSFQREPKGKS